MVIFCFGIIITIFTIFIMIITTPFNWLPPTPSIGAGVETVLFLFPIGMVTFLVAHVEAVVPVLYSMVGAPPILFAIDGDGVGGLLGSPWLVFQPCERWGFFFTSRAASSREVEAGKFGFDAGVNAGLDGAGLGWRDSAPSVHGVGEGGELGLHGC